MSVLRPFSVDSWSVFLLEAFDPAAACTKQGFGQLRFVPLVGYKWNRIKNAFSALALRGRLSGVSLGYACGRIISHLTFRREEGILPSGIVASGHCDLDFFPST